MGRAEESGRGSKGRGMASPSSLTQGLIKGRWKVVRKIGAGAFGEIFQGKNVVTSEDVAVKASASRLG